MLYKSKTMVENNNSYRHYKLVQTQLLEKRKTEHEPGEERSL